ncbi:UDP-N-acetylmuramoyl-tripeptide--D-alanyl-D-alanine ligase [Candidatus Clavichlamydia salmonicola]|uniref:UDP-N-acetylmuramoyl-tripeptide--D-alanyl-D- alanine ligase n=1 Tax=Candidatus Clavichlamydia salmonicola TaxID=469812 RepID=UPI001890CCC2|nr:UDP-N-acetylmuramoyl-tripeptide--D-alanyl-D-alanine ligase [Candidatus Clavichlamydia salmonicola]
MKGKGMRSGLLEENFVEFNDLKLSPEKILGIAIDSRLVNPGDLFFALPGNRVDGHSFIKEAKDKGAVGVVLLKGKESLSEGLSFLAVEDVADNLRKLAKIVLQKKAIPIIGITGSLGKTTVKYFLKDLLSNEFNIFWSPKNYNTRLSLPMSIIMAEEEQDFLLLEMGSSEPGDLDQLLAFAPPTIAVLTGIAPQHAKFFANGIQGIAEEKARIFSSSLLTTALFPLDSPYTDLFHQKTQHVASVFTFANHDVQASFSFSLIKEDFVIIKHPQGETKIKIHFSYKPAYRNLLIAFSTAFIAGVPVEKLLFCIENNELKMPPMRFESVKRQGIVFINDAYNALPESMKAALEAMPSALNGKKIAVLAQMNEIGVYSEEGHKEAFISACQHVDYLICIGPFWECCKDVVPNAKKNKISFVFSTEEGAVYLQKLAQSGDIILLKGSRTFELEKLINLYE